MIRRQLFALADKKYAVFQSKLTPTVPSEQFIGVRVPVLRKLAKTLHNTNEAQQFLHQVPHKYFDENMLHSLLICELCEYEQCLVELERFLPYIDNWAVCDILSPKLFKKHRQDLIIKVKEWIGSSHSYTCRFGIGMLMQHFLEEDFREEYLQLPASIHSEEYYVQMMVAWFFATALAKQWDATIVYLEEKRLDKTVHRKTIQKAIESYRVTEQQKAYLRTLR